MPTSKIYYRRKFLNLPRQHSGAHVIAKADVESFIDRPPYINADIHLTDCSRNILLDFDVSSKVEARNALHKARLLREVLAEYVDAMERAVETWDEQREAYREEQRKKRNKPEQPDD